MQLNLYLIQVHHHSLSDVYDSAVVVAVDYQEAAAIHPKGKDVGRAVRFGDKDWTTDDWTGDLSEVSVTLVAKKAEKMYNSGDVVCSSFNAA